MQTWKNIIKIGCLAAISLVLLSCLSSESQNIPSSNAENLSSKNTENARYENQHTIVGNALGTTFVVKTSEDSLRISPSDLEVFFEDFNAELSTYIPNSLISRFNAKDTAINLNHTKYFQTSFEKSQEVYRITNGAFDPSVFPLVKLWGFVFDIDKKPEREKIDSVLQFVGFEEEKLYTYENGILSKKDERFQLVFNAIAKGQAVDEIAKILDERGQKSYYVEIGGELITKGLNNRGSKWIIGIDEPVESNTGIEGIGERTLENYIELSGKAMATSGNYRDFYELDGAKYSHTLSSKTGLPVRKNILSATVIADDVATADAYATAFMEMGVDSSLALLTRHPSLNIEAYLLFNNENNKIERAYSDGMSMYLTRK